MRVAAVQPLDELGHRADLVAAELEVGDELEAVVDGRHVAVGRRSWTGLTGLSVGLERSSFT